jgi:Tfp pilus assembly protein PilX
MTPLPTARAALAAAEDELRRIEQAHDLAHVTGTWAAAQRVIRRCQDDLIHALAAQIQADCATAAEHLTRIEAVARDAMATPHTGA